MDKKYNYVFPIKCRTIQRCNTSSGEDYVFAYLLILCTFASADKKNNRAIVLKFAIKDVQHGELFLYAFLSSVF